MPIAMKKILLSVIVSFVAIITAGAQEQTYRYRTLSEFQGDTIGFLNNLPLEDIKGKSVDNLIKIINRELPVKQLCYSVNTKDTTVFQSLELIFDDRRQIQIADQLHFWVFDFEEEYTANDVKTILGFAPGEIVVMTPALRKRLKQFIFSKSPVHFIAVQVEYR